MPDTRHNRPTARQVRSQRALVLVSYFAAPGTEKLGAAGKCQMPITRNFNGSGQVDVTVSKVVIREKNLITVSGYRPPNSSTRMSISPMRILQATGHRKDGCEFAAGGSIFIKSFKKLLRRVQKLRLGKTRMTNTTQSSLLPFSN